jgi:KipI family sensor histidine kinase inhibitor
VSAQSGLSIEEVVETVVASRPHVLAIGFLPGFPFCGPAPAPLALKRRATPRTRVPPGSVAVANGFIGIYPWVSPGGWHILGATRLPLFDTARETPALLAPGDRLRFIAVDADAMEGEAHAPPEAFLLEEAAP